MGRVDWAMAEASYISGHASSYAGLAKHYGVAKSTVVRHAMKESWPEKRKMYSRKRINLLEERTLEKRNEVEEKQLRILRITEAVFNNEILRLGTKQQRGEEISGKEWRDIINLTGAMTKAIMMERVILGLRTKPVRITDEDAIENIQIMMGYKEEPPRKQLEELKEVALTLDRMIERKKMIQQMIDSYDM